MEKIPCQKMSEYNKNVIHVISGLHPKSGGPSRSVTQLVDALADKAKIGIRLLSQGRTGEPFVSPRNACAGFRFAESDFQFPLKLGVPVARELLRSIKHEVPSIVHSHGIWLPAYHWVARIAKSRGIPLALHPHGMLEPWALSHRSLKKKIALSLYQRRDLDSVALFFATAAQEAESIRRLGLKQPIAVIPNGVEFASEQGELGSVAETTQLRTVRNVVFMSRIHPKKGLLNLIEAWAQVRPLDCRLLLAGPDEGGHLSAVMHRVVELHLVSSVQYVGEVADVRKPEFFGSADLFVLPTFSENFGVVIAEALSFGVPVITTHGAPWEGLPERDCGWWVEPTVDALASALRAALEMSPDRLRIMGQKGKLYAREFAWPGFAQQTLNAYRWLLGLQDRPGCIVLD